MSDTSQTTANTKGVMARAFLNHPQAVGETYLQHFAVSGRFALIMARLCGCALLHAFVPALCEKTVSTRIIELADELRSRSH